MIFSCSCAWLFWAFVIYKVLDYLIRKPHVRGRLNRYILVTGCDTGFGHEIAKRLDRNGYSVFAGCLTERGEEILNKQCSSRLKTIRMNVADHDSVQKAYDVVVESLPPGKGLWGLVNNAGITGPVGPLAWLKLSDYDQVMGVNLNGVIDVTSTFLPLVKRAKGRVVCTSSVFGRTSLIGGVPYAVSKYGVEAFTDGLRRELHDFGGSAHLIEPGFHKTNIVRKSNILGSLERTWNNLSEELKAEYGEEYYQQTKVSLVDKFLDMVCSDRISDVVDAYENALLAIFPRARYVVGLDAKIFWLPVQWLPEWLGDWILRTVTPERPIPAIVKKRN